MNNSIIKKATSYQGINWNWFMIKNTFHPSEAEVVVSKSGEVANMPPPPQKNYGSCEWGFLHL